MDDLIERLDALIATVSGARAMPLSTSCLVNRVELLAALDDLRMLVPEALADADRVMADREAILAEAHREAAEVVRRARGECSRLAARSAVANEAGVRAAEIVASARATSDTMRVEIDRYVDAKLAEFESLLRRTLASVSRGRERLGEVGPGPAGTPAAWPPRPPAASVGAAADGHARIAGAPAGTADEPVVAPAGRMGGEKGDRADGGPVGHACDRPGDHVSGEVAGIEAPADDGAAAPIG
jgi:hypothetical protein